MEEDRSSLERLDVIARNLDGCCTGCVGEELHVDAACYRLKSVRNIEKITKVSVETHAVYCMLRANYSLQSMKVVASTKLTRAEKAMREAKKYGSANERALYSIYSLSCNSADVRASR